MLVIDAGEPRNAPADHVHGYLGREGTPPSDLLAIGRAEVAAYGVEVREGRPGRPRHRDGTFVVELAGGEAVSGRRLLVATGGHDELPAIPGVAERWGRDVIHCPYCHGWEVRDRSIVVISTNGMGVHGASLFRQLSDDVTLVVHAGPGPTEAERAQLTGRGVRIVEAPFAELVVTDGRLTGVRLDDGSACPAAAAVVSPRLTARADLLAPLGLEPVEGPMGLGTTIPADATGPRRARRVRRRQRRQPAGPRAAIGGRGGDGGRGDQRRPRHRGQPSAPAPGVGRGVLGGSYRSKPRSGAGSPTRSSSPTSPICSRGRRSTSAPARGRTPSGWPSAAGGSWPSTSRPSPSIGARQAEELGVADQIGWVHLDVTAAAPPPARSTWFRPSSCTSLPSIVARCTPRSPMRWRRVAR